MRIHRAHKHTDTRMHARTHAHHLSMQTHKKALAKEHFHIRIFVLLVSSFYIKFILYFFNEFSKTKGRKKEKKSSKT